MFGFIKNFFSGIAAFFTGLFSSNKSPEIQSSSPKTKKESGFFLQLDEAEDTDKKATSAQSAKAQTAQPKPPEPTTKAATFAAAPAPAAVKAEPAKVEAKKPEPPKTEPAKIEPAKKPEPVAANNNGSANNNGKAATSAQAATFAPQYLNPTSSSSNRRRPGANMNSFLDLARQVKTPNA